MECPVHEDGHVCSMAGVHREHASWVRDQSDPDDLGHWVMWFDAQSEVGPKARTRGTFTNKELADMATAIEQPPKPLSEDGKVGNDHPSNAKRSARITEAGSQRAFLLRLVAEAGEEGLTSFHAAPEMGMSPNQVATRMGELREANLVLGLEETRETTPGHTAHVHVTLEHWGRRKIDQSLKK